MTAAAIDAYLVEIAKQLSSGSAAEHAYRPALQRLMESFGGNTAVNDPKRSEHGAPDFVFKNSSNAAIALGYAEAKDIDINLDVAEGSEQMRRYAGYANLILTNYLEFRFYRNGAKYQTLLVAERQGDGITPLPTRFAALSTELAAFLELPPESITDGARLAEVMGAKAQRIRLNVAWFLTDRHERSKSEELIRIYGLIKELLVHDLDASKFADMYAQTLVYGLFAARYDDPSSDTFSRQEARDLLPASNPFLREFFDHIAGPHFDKRLAFIVDELCAVFAVSGVRAIVHEHIIRPTLTGDPTDDKDPIIHFYEDFLQAYDPEQRKKMGAYYTPVPVVRFMVRMVDHLLRGEFGLTGLADTSKTRRTVIRADKKVTYEFHKVQILDPAVGTATFLNEIIEFIRRGFAGQEGRWPAFVREDLVPRISGFELMMAPYTVAHLKLGLTLRESGVTDFGGRLGVYLTNTLDEGMGQPQSLFHFGLAEAVAQEALHAGEIKTERPIMVVIGNPPYAAISSNETEWANALVDRYKVEPGGKAKLKERKHWLNDDYVKFLSFAEQMIERNGSGVVAMITNHGYLDNPTFRGMRWRLAQTFDVIYVLDLHGNTMKKETPPDGSRDENVFEIQQGVAILFGVRAAKEEADQKTKRKPARVLHADLWGTRHEKFAQLNADKPRWRELPLSEPMNYFVPRDLTGEADYLSGVSVADLFPIKVTGVVTMGDPFIVARSRDVLMERLTRYVAGEYDAARLRREFALGKNYPEWVLSEREGFEIEESRFIRYAYRPFDDRWTYLDRRVIWRIRDKVSRHFLRHSNIGLIVSRQAVTDRWSHVQLTPHVADNRIHYSNKGIPLEIPLYLYHDDVPRTANLNPATVRALTRHVSASPTPETVLDYVYGALHSPFYRRTFHEFLKRDFPYVPIPADDDDWHRLAGLGRQLRDLHLMSAPEGTALATTYPATGSDVVKAPRFDDGRVWINEDQYFGGVPESAWTLVVGGYVPAQRWLKERAGTTLSSEEIVHYQRMITVLAQTHAIMEEIDR
jgi:hypothetical protein